MIRTLKIVLAYDGTGYVGWQRQARGLSIQGLLEDALRPLNGGRAATVVGAGRTDAGVHAAGQVASCLIDTDLDVHAIARALNARLPADLRVRDVADAPEGFHARFWCASKTYAYRVLNAAVADPHARAFVWHVRPRLDAPAMRAALALVEGTHDFRAFQSSGSSVSHTTRTLTAASLAVRAWGGLFERDPCVPSDRAEGDVAAGQAAEALGDRLLTFRFVADGFLRHMVRSLVGTIVEVGLGRRAARDLEDLLARGDRRAVGPTAPASGLVLVRAEHRAAPRAPEHLPPPQRHDKI